MRTDVCTDDIHIMRSFQEKKAHVNDSFSGYVVSV
jgi:hypothetical protein